jgi:hypothetical protein
MALTHDVPNSTISNHVDQLDPVYMAEEEDEKQNKLPPRQTMMAAADLVRAMPADGLRSSRFAAADHDAPRSASSPAPRAPPTGASNPLHQARERAAEFRRLTALAAKLGLEGGVEEARAFVRMHAYTAQEIDELLACE